MLHSAGVRGGYREMITRGIEVDQTHGGNSMGPRGEVEGGEQTSGDERGSCASCGGRLDRHRSASRLRLRC
jgi:rRNA maturation endonuclease Nob1